MQFFGIAIILNIDANYKENDAFLFIFVVIRTPALWSVP